MSFYSARTSVWLLQKFAGVPHDCKKKQWLPSDSPKYTLLQMVPQLDNKYFIFATDRHIGIQMLPADGNPYKYLGVVGHPNKVTIFNTTIKNHSLVFSRNAD